MTIAQRTRQTATRQNRQRQHRAEVRMDEIVSVAGIADDYSAADRAGDLRMESHFQAMYALADDDEERTAVARAYAEWGKGEQIEGMAVEEAVRIAVDLLKSNNPIFINGAATPRGSGDAA